MSARRRGAPRMSSGMRRICWRSIRRTPRSAACETATGCGFAQPGRARRRCGAQVTDRVAPGVVYTTFHHPVDAGERGHDGILRLGDELSGYKVTAVQVSPSNGPSRLAGGISGAVDARAGASRRGRGEVRHSAMATLLPCGATVGVISDVAMEVHAPAARGCLGCAGSWQAGPCRHAAALPSECSSRHRIWTHATAVSFLTWQRRTERPREVADRADLQPRDPRGDAGDAGRSGGFRDRLQPVGGHHSTRPAEVQALEIVVVPDGIELRMDLRHDRSEALTRRQRRLAGPSGCGLCGMDSLAAAIGRPRRCPPGDVSPPP